MIFINKRDVFFLIFFCLVISSSFSVHAQSITGVWRGKITQHRFGLDKIFQLELKLIRDGDSLTGTSYYFSSENNYYRFAVKGYFDPSTGYVVWWDEQLIETILRGKRSAPTEDGLRYAADFNCPGEGIMKLEGNAEKKNEGDDKPLVVNLDKVPVPFFGDEWDFVIENFAMGANDPAIIDSIENLVANAPVTTTTLIEDTVGKKEPIAVIAPPIATPLPDSANRKIVVEKVVATEKRPALTAPQTIMDKFLMRKKELVTEIPIEGDSIELNFYDHAEIDGDSISLFLNNKLIHEHILLKASPYTIKLATSELRNSNELIMVAENLGAIPPNTSLMIVYINGQRHEARLESSENASAMIRFIRKTK